MPWTLHYAPTIDGRIEMNAHRALLSESNDVLHVEVTRGESPQLVVHFVDESLETDSPALRRIWEAHVEPTRPDPPPWETPPSLWQLDEDPHPQFTQFPLRGFQRTGEPNQNGDVFPPEVRDRVISEYIQTQSGRTRLAASMIAPLRRSLDYQSVARRTFLVEQLPEGALPIYNQDPGIAGMVGGVGIQSSSDIPPDPLHVPEWVRPGQWVYFAREDRYGRIENMTDPTHTYRYVRVKHWRFTREEDVIALGSFVSLWTPCEKPAEPRSIWARLLDDEEE